VAGILGPMSARPIPPEEWIKFFDDFSKKHENWIVTIEVVGSPLGDQHESTRLPLVGISADVKAGERRVVVQLGGRFDANLTRIIERP
jgi:hypothetical protein